MAAALYPRTDPGGRRSFPPRLTIHPLVFFTGSAKDATQLWIGVTT